MRLLPYVIIATASILVFNRVKNKSGPSDISYTVNLTADTVHMDDAQDPSIVLCATNQSGRILKSFEDTDSEYVVRLDDRLPADEHINSSKNLSFLWPGRTVQRSYARSGSNAASVSAPHFGDHHFDLLPGDTCELYTNIYVGPQVFHELTNSAKGDDSALQAQSADGFRIDRPGNYRFRIYRVDSNTKSESMIGKVMLHVLPANGN